MLKSKVLAAVLAACVAGLPVLHGYADELSEKQAEYDRVQQQMRDMEAQREEARRAADAASSRMEEVVSELRQLQIRLDEINARQEELDAAIADNQAKLAEEKANLERRMNIFKKRLRDIYINGQINYLDVLLGAKDFSDFSSRMFLLQKIISRDIAMLDAINKSMAEIEKRQEELDAQTKELDALRAELEVKRQEAEARREERAQLLYAAEEERSQVEGEYDRLAAISENIASMLRSLQNAGGMPGGGGTGKFIWPVQGEITSYYGWRTHPIFGTTRYHSGYDIACDTGTPIAAADSGTVVYSGWLGGYGYCVMIDHGGGLVSLYGHNSELWVSEGQYVQQGQTIALAGSTGWSTGPHCHFEARLNGELTDPMNYLP